MKFNVARINLCTENEGPFKRMAIWFQGCSIGCEGCCNPELQPFKVAHFMTLDELVNAAKKAKIEYGIEGITYLGGEPTLQKNLEELNKVFHELGLGIILFTGFIITDLKEAIISSVDLVIDGPYIKKHHEIIRNLVGSSNQQFHHISSRYIESMDWFLVKRPKQVDINIVDDFIITGDVVL